MSLNELATLLQSIPEFSGKVAYYAFPEGEAPELPYIDYLETGENNFIADNTVIYRQISVDIELYTALKDPQMEKAVEDALSSAELIWTKNEDYLDSDRCYMITYTVAI